MNIRQAMRAGLQKQASEMVDRMIPAGGASAREVLMGLGALDLDEDGSDAFGAMDLDDDGSDAFGQMDLDAGGSDAFGSMDLDEGGSDAFGGLGRWRPFKKKPLKRLARAAAAATPIGAFAKKVKTIAKAKSTAAKSVLRDIAAKTKWAKAKAALAERRQALSTNPMQKEAAAQQKAAAVAEVKKLVKVGREVAEEAVDPKVTREEVKAAVMPEVAKIAEGAAEGASDVIREAAETQTAPSEEQVRAEITSKVAEAVTGEPVAVPRFAPPTGWWTRFMAAITGKPAPVSAPGAASSYDRRTGPRRNPFTGEWELPPKSMSGTAFIGVADIETMQQEPLGADIVKSWRTDDVFGEPDIF